MTAGLTMPEMSVQMTMTDPWATPEWIDVTNWTTGIDTVRGRQHELQRFQSGTCNLSMWNPDGRFSTFNPTSPYVNQLSAADAQFQDGSLGTWVPNPATAPAPELALAVGVGIDGTDALAVTSLSGGGDMSVSTAITAASGSYPVTAGNTYGAMVRVHQPAGAYRTIAAGLVFYNASDVAISGTPYVFGSPVTEDSGWVAAYVTATAPASAVRCAVYVVIEGTAGSETHYIQRSALYSADQWGQVNTAWGPGGRGGLSPVRPVKVTATWTSTTYPIFAGFVSAWVPAYKANQSRQVIQCADAMSLLALPYVTTSAYPSMVEADGAQGYWRLGDPAYPPGGDFANEIDTSPSTLAGNGATNWFTFGEAPGAIVSDTNSAVLFTSPASASMSGTAPTSVDFWLNTTTTTDSVLVQLGVFQLSALWINAGVLYYQGPTAPSGDYVAPVSTGVTVNDGKWHHVAIVGQPVPGGFGHSTIYVDGVQVATPYYAGGSDTGSFILDPPTNVVDSAGDVAPNGLDECMFGELVFYGPSVYLTAAQVAAHYQCGLTGFIQQQSGQRIEAVLIALGLGAPTNIATGISAVQAPPSPLTTQLALSYIQQVEKTEQGAFLVDESGVITFYDRHYTITNPACLVSNCTVANDNAGGHLPFVDGSLVPTEDTLDLWPDVPTSAQVNASIGVTGALSDAQNFDSEAAYCRRSLTGYTSLLQVDDQEPAELGQWLLSRYGVPLTRVRAVTLDSTANGGGNLPNMLGRKLLDLITVGPFQPLDGSGEPFTQLSLIEKVQHSITKELWTTTWSLTPQETVPYLILNDPVRGQLGTDNRLGY